MLSNTEMRHAFEEAQEHAVQVYPTLASYLNRTRLLLVNHTQGHALMSARHLLNEIIVYLPELEKGITGEKSYQDMYNMYIHEFSHLIQHEIDSYSAGHGAEFKRIAKILGLKHPNTKFVHAGKILYRMAVPVGFNQRTQKPIKKYFFASKEWLDDHPDYKQYVIKALSE